MGALNSRYGQRQNNNFKKRNQYWQPEGDIIVRILPVTDRFTDDPYKWNQFHAVVKGFKNLEGKNRMFESVLQKKNKEIVTADAAVDRIQGLKEALLKAKENGDGALMKQLNDLVGMKGVYSIDKKWHMNVMTLEGAVGTFAINYTAKAKLDIEIEKLMAKGIDPLSLDNGRFFVFSKSNAGGKATFEVRVYEEEIDVPGHGKMKKEVVAKNITDSWNRIEQDMVDLDTLYTKITPQEVEEIVKESDLKTGKSAACDRIFDARWKAEREAKKAQQPTAQSTMQTTTHTVSAPKPAVTPKAETPKPVQATAETVLAGLKETVKVAPKTEPTLEASLDEMDDEEFFRKAGVEI